MNIKSPYSLIFILAIINLLIAVFLVGAPLRMNSDAPSYLNAMNFLQGQGYDSELLGPDTEIITKARILTTPLMLYSSIFFGKLFGNGYQGMLLVNIIFYFLIAFVFYKLIELIYQNRLVSFLGTILFLTNYCMYNYGITYRADIGGWLFFLLTTLLAVRYFQKPTDQKFFYLAILSASFGVLFKEYGALGLIPLAILILFLPNTFAWKIKKLIQTGLLFLIIPVLYHLFIYFQFHLSYFDWYNYAFTGVINNPDSPGTDWGFLLLFKVLAWLFLVGWPIFVFGLYKEWSAWRIGFQKRAKILLAILPACLAFLAWPGLTQRIAFILVPWLAMISGYGLSKIKSRYLIVLILIVYLAVNYLTRPWLLSVINI